ncbi:MAG TPA: hypothetical protein VLH40_06060 [Atribacteraceae bacterium]|nr:hypothetical protein [Atribacteraceae bacterium]
MNFRLALIVLCLILFSTTLANAQAPTLREQLVYSLTSFNGTSFSRSFCPPNEDRLFFIADELSVIDAQKTLVYFWPITRRYMAGFNTLNETLPGSLEILQGGKVIATLERETYALFYPHGYWSDKAMLYSGEEAIRIFNQYQQAVEEFNQRLRQHFEAMRLYQEKFNRFLEEIRRRRETGEVGPTDLDIPLEPQPPEFVGFFVTELREGFILNLPPGNFEIRLRSEDGLIYEGSEKQITTFTARRTGGVGYEIIPGNRWTRRENVDDPSRIIHGVGRNNLYFNPFEQTEFNELYHNQLEDPQADGRIERWKWVHTNPIHDVQIILSKGEEVLQRVERLPFFVKQIPGPELGFEIIPYDDVLRSQGHQPTFEGHLLSLDEKLVPTEYIVSAVRNADAQPVEGSERIIRILRKENAPFLYAIAFLPLLFGAIVLLVRWGKIEKK